MKKGEIFEGRVERLDFPDRGILHIGEETVLVKHVLPGQQIRAAAGKRRGGRWEGRLIEGLPKQNGIFFWRRGKGRASDAGASQTGKLP